MKTESIRAKLALISGIALLAIVFSVGFSYYLAVREAKGIMEEGLNSVADALERSLAYVARVKPDALQDSAFLNQMNSIKLGKSGYVYFINDKGIMVSHPTSQGKDQTGVPHNDYIRAHKEGGILEYVATTTKQDKIAAYRYIEPWKGWIVPGVNKADYFESLKYSFLKWNLACAVVTILLLLTLSAWITRGIMTPIKEVIRIADRMAEGDLGTEIEVKGRGEMSQMLAAMKNMLARVRGIVTSVADASSHVASASSQLMGTAEEMAGGAGDAASQIDSVAAKGEELARVAGEIARNCSEAAEASRRMNGSTEDGERLVRETVSIMHDITARVKDSTLALRDLGETSDKIGTIVSTINDIADQTNLLALNAAIEAARAGEQGRGFAVVADEVRALAERTTGATREIGEMITAIQERTRNVVFSMEEGIREVERGNEKASVSGEALRDIRIQTDMVATEVGNIARSAEQQTATTTEISGNVQMMTAIVHRTAEGAGESTAAANRLAALAGNLEHLVGQFKLHSGE